jgi:hypothetical protein
MSFKIFNRNSIILVTYDGTHKDNEWLDGMLLTRSEVDYLLRNLGGILDGLNKLKTNEKIVLLTEMPEANIVITDSAITTTECKFKEFTRQELVAFVDSVPALSRWV